MTNKFFKRNTKYRGDDRELYFTPINVVEKIVESLLEHRPYLKNKIWVDPCAGDGRWQNVIEKYKIKCYSFDICPLSSGVGLSDFLKDTRWVQDNLFFIGNPPFSLLEKFVAKALHLTEECYFLGGSQAIANSLAGKVSLLHRFEGFEGNQKDLRSKILFNDTFNEDVFVWCCGALFNRKFHNNFKIITEKDETNFRISIQNYCIPDDRVVVINK